MRIKTIIIYSVFLIFAALLLLLKFAHQIFEDEYFIWLLAPSTFLVEIFTGYPFSFVTNTGYVSFDGIITISKKCAGINLFILTNLISIYILSKRKTQLHKKLFLLFPYMLIAFLFTIFTNAIRISFSIYFEPIRHSVPILLKAKSWLHYGIGTFIFFFSIILYYFFITRGIQWIKKKIQQI